VGERPYDYAAIRIHLFPGGGLSTWRPSLRRNRPRHH
jgi:hypothetical protein